MPDNYSLKVEKHLLARLKNIASENIILDDNLSCEEQIESVLAQYIEISVDNISKRAVKDDRKKHVVALEKALKAVKPPENDEQKMYYQGKVSALNNLVRTLKE